MCVIISELKQLTSSYIMLHLCTKTLYQEVRKHDASAFKACQKYFWNHPSNPALRPKRPQHTRFHKKAGLCSLSEAGGPFCSVTYSFQKDSLWSLLIQSSKNFPARVILAKWWNLECYVGETKFIGSFWQCFLLFRKHTSRTFIKQLNCETSWHITSSRNHEFIKRLKEIQRILKKITSYHMFPPIWWMLYLCS